MSFLLESLVQELVDDNPLNSLTESYKPIVSSSFLLEADDDESADEKVDDNEETKTDDVPDTGLTDPSLNKDTDGAESDESTDDEPPATLPTKSIPLTLISQDAMTVSKQFAVFVTYKNTFYDTLDTLNLLQNNSKYSEIIQPLIDNLQENIDHLEIIISTDFNPSKIHLYEQLLGHFKSLHVVFVDLIGNLKKSIGSQEKPK